MASLEQHNLSAGILTKSSRQHRSGRAAANNDDIRGIDWIGHGYLLTFFERFLVPEAGQAGLFWCGFVLYAPAGLATSGRISGQRTILRFARMAFLGADAGVVGADSFQSTGL
jgi:hypothetical protein